jgi:hypothetical protein
LHGFKRFLTPVQLLSLFSRGTRLKLQSLDRLERVNAMTEYQKIAIGLLGVTHPEIYLSLREPQGSRRTSSAPPPDEPPPYAPPPYAPRERTTGRREPGANALVRTLKFALAALLAGARTVPMGDNSQLTKELSAYGVRLHCRLG